VFAIAKVLPNGCFANLFSPAANRPAAPAAMKDLVLGSYPELGARIPPGPIISGGVIGAGGDGFINLRERGGLTAYAKMGVGGVVCCGYGY